VSGMREAAGTNKTMYGFVVTITVTSEVVLTFLSLSEVIRETVLILK